MKDLLVKYSVIAPRTNVEASYGLRIIRDGKGIGTYTSTGVRPPWVTEQQTAPAKANLEYRANPVSGSGVLAAPASTFDAAIVLEE
jgi:hypothetical protein